MPKFVKSEFYSNIREEVEIHKICGELRVFVNGEELQYKHRNRDYIEELIRRCIDLDEWKNSWHMKVGTYTYDKAVGAELKEIINEKIAERKSQLEALEFVKMILDSVEYSEDEECEETTP